MATLLADVGGTNARLAIARDGRIDRDTVTRFRGDDHAAFDDVVHRFLEERGGPRIDAVCIAVAGPVSGGRARLTNRDWDFDEARLARLTGAGRVRLINDLTALGHAAPVLGGEGLAVLREAPAGRARNGQGLVVNLGTGFNVCAMRRLPGGGAAVLEAEEGHTRLPVHIHRRLLDAVGPDAIAGFPSTEELFAGRGLARLHAARTGTPPLRSEQVDAAADAGDAAAQATYALFVELVGLICRELALRFMPLEGMFLAGSVARSIAARMDRFEAAFLDDPVMRHIPENTPVFLIRDDMAALQGCLAALSQGPQVTES